MAKDDFIIHLVRSPDITLDGFLTEVGNFMKTTLPSMGVDVLGSLPVSARRVDDLQVIVSADRIETLFDAIRTLSDHVAGGVRTPADLRRYH